MVLCNERQLKIRFFPFGFWKSASFLFSNCTSERVLWTRSWGQPLSCTRDLRFRIWSSNFLLGEFVLRSLRASLLMKPFLHDPWWVAQREVHKCFSSFKVRTHIKNWIACESFTFIDVCIQKCRFCFWNFGRKFNCLFACLMNCSISSLFRVQREIFRLYIVSKWAVWMRFGLTSPFQT